MKRTNLRRLLPILLTLVITVICIFGITAAATTTTLHSYEIKYTSVILNNDADLIFWADIDEDTAQKDSDFMSPENWNLLSFDDTSFDHITTSLNFLGKGPYGSTYYWVSKNTSVITNSGRVIRPRWNEEAKVVVVELHTVYGSATKTKEFTFTVIPEEELKDPKHMSDEDFFGVWNGSTWTTESKFKYESYPDLAKVEAAAKLGDYELAKLELLNYMKERPKSFVVGSISRDTSYAEAFTMSNIYDSENHSHYAALIK